ncbi:M15 family metallopeptidase [Trichlorobacter ammonificans]
MLAEIARDSYGTAPLTRKLADYNGITNPNLLRVGEYLELPARLVLAPPAAVPAASGALQPPHSLEGIIATFGDIRRHIRDDGHLNPAWETGHLATAPIPFAIPLSWDRTRRVQGIYCHKLLAPLVSDLFRAIQQEGLQEQITTFGGCFNCRPKRQSNKLSTHSWGIAIDLNPETNRQGSPGDMSGELVALFKRYGFAWGGTWSGRNKDPMHFQFCTGY